MGELKVFTDILARKDPEKVRFITGAPLTEIHEKLNKIIDALESEKSDDDGENK
jgi:hypothetical protein